MQKISGINIAKSIIQELKKQEVPKKILAVILVGDNSESLSFLKQKEKIAKELSVDFRVYKFPEDTKNDDLRKEVGKIASLKNVGGVIIQLPLPDHLNRHYILNVIPREKDVDVLGERALGAFYTGRNPILPPAVATVEEILNSKSYILNSKKVAVVGAGFLVGKPVITWLMSPVRGEKVKELCVFKSGSDLSKLKNFDLIISGVGQAGIIKPEMLKDNVGVIDFGYSIKQESRIMNNESSKKIYGDFDVSRIQDSRFKIHASGFYTPTPGGTGPILVAKLFENFYNLNAD